MNTSSDLQNKLSGFDGGFQRTSRSWQGLTFHTISEGSAFRFVWDLWIMALIFVSTGLIPFQIAFVHQPQSLGTYVLYLIDLFFIIDIGLNFLTTYRRHGVEITDPKLTAIQYLKTYFAVDFIANVPLDLLLLGSQEIQVFGISSVLLFRTMRMLRIFRLFAIFGRWENLSWTHSGKLRIIKFFSIVFLLIHWLACTWFLIAYIEDFPEDSWATMEEIIEADVGTQYLRSLYWSITTMTTVGYGDITPHRNSEYIFTSLAMLLGASLYAYIIGNIASLVSHLDAAKVSFSNRVEAVTQYLRYRQVPNQLNERVKNYYEYVWDQHRGLKEDVFFDDLPRPLRLDVLLHLTRELLEKVPLFKFCSPALRNMLLMTLRAQTFAPDGYIVREGELGKEIFFISRGLAEITSNNGENHHGTFEDGDYFGDLSLILGEPRSGSVRALTYCEIFILTQADFNRIKGEYPEFKEVLKKMSSERSEKMTNLLLDGVVL